MQDRKFKSVCYAGQKDIFFEGMNKEKCMQFLLFIFPVFQDVMRFCFLFVTLQNNVCVKKKATSFFLGITTFQYSYFYRLVPGAD